MSRHHHDLLWQSSLRFLLQHPWHFLLSILGVALGVAMVISIDLSNSSAQRAFSLSAEALTGKATHQIQGSGDFLSDQVYRDLRLTAGYRNSAPVIDGYGRVQGLDRTFQILGVDPIAEGPFRDFSSQDGGIDLAKFITGQPTAVISDQVLEDLAKNIGDSLQVSVGGRPFDLLIAGAIATANQRSQQALESVLLVDINTAQQLFDMDGQLSRIDLIVPDENLEAILASLLAGLPEGTRLVSSGSRTDTLSQMTRAFELNLQALSLLALLVGMFLIYNTMTFSVVQRLPLIGRLRALGVTKSEVLSMIVKEAVLIGLIGTILGITAGIGLAQFLLGLVTQSINDLYFVLSVQELTIELIPVLKAVTLGLGATLLAAFWPAREAAEAEVSTVLRRSSSESRLAQRLPSLALTGLAVGLAGGGILLFPNGGIIAGYSSLLFVIIGFSLLIPALIVGLSVLIRPILGALNGLIGKMSVRGVVTELSRTSVAVAALVVAVAASVGVGVMVDSFRVTVVSWLESQLQADIYVQPPSAVARKADAQLQAELVRIFKETEGVASVHSVFSEDVMTTFGSSNLVTTSLGAKASESYQTKEIQDGFWEQFAQEEVIMISEAYAYRFGIGMGDSLGIMTDKGMQSFPIQAIYFDYASDMGTITMNRSLYDRYFDNRAISGLALYADDKTEVDVLVNRLRDRAVGVQEVFIRSNKGLREASIEIFDRTFTVTVVLRLLAVVVAFVGILSSLMALQLERAREHAVLRANGMTPGQLWNYVITQTGVMGVIAGVLSIPLGLLISYVLVYVINLRSFGWTLEFMVSPSLLIQAVGLAVGAALLAGIYPSWKMARANPADALRSE
ncbi:MAG: FtsX-like permease family protein [Bacteroidetes bacterium]|nr:FtsX-like permease family protein [Bacteroidota bacterium]